ncbi:MaoC/PaaZ C-terminal domain-containing protein [Aeromicrobium wangtongii]|uniref:MaoC/PaaZ C-terminal domain-containing protein n=1 Tax=Aeromicrobium wangtongii TaxID=2969247 RepID=A0ABY5MB91_9ACTN|nr:MaoC/PaaZ C-terminal domain-containing protein [Aeromicrobium wangtongii]MCD9197905.1 MaoC family dehydratase N-terminal domain-containing protein [Aeromicrobium wangtongii]UUP15383.1 MaoC/PaaZ C-terminal domain-containing protein [Aeromicrobium wangtongii]
MTRPWWFEDFEVGQRFITQGRTITEADIGSFAAWSWDTNPVHTDAVHAASGRFGVPIAHGILGTSVALGLLSRLGIFETCSIALLGVDDWRFVAPIVAGDTVRCELEIIGTRLTSRGDAGILDRSLVLVNQHDRPVQRGRIGLMVATRPDDSPPAEAVALGARHP